VTPVRLLLLALVVTDLLVPAGMSLSSGAVAVADHVDCASQTSHDGDDDHTRGALVRVCVCCSAEPETAAPRSEPTLQLPSEPHDVAVASGPITEAYIRLPFRPPMAA
jgi:hypothetical protein